MSVLWIFFGSQGPVTAAFVLVAGYSLYRSAKALVPLNRITAVQPEAV